MSQSRFLSGAIPPAKARPRWAWLAFVAALAVIVAGLAIDRWRAAPVALDPATLRAGYGPASFAEAEAIAQRNLAAARDSVARFPGEWLREEAVARALIARFRQTDDYRDLAEADAILDRAIATTPDPAGPVLSKAMLAIMVHRLDQADAALARFARWAAPDPADSADAAALAGDVALQRGDLIAAGKHFALAERIGASPGIGLRRALLAAQRGERAEAKRASEALLAKPRQQPSVLAELALQRANLAYREGDWDGAAGWVKAANRVYPGYWLGEAYAAQNKALAGETAAAADAYRTLAMRTGRPEVMDALAHLLRLEGRVPESRSWAGRAAAGWEQRGALFPEAVAAHRAEHELAVGSAARALGFAQADAARRPHGPSLALLARTLLLAGRPRQALAALDRAERQGWVGAGLLGLRADAAAALGDSAGAEAARERALAINPKASDPRARLIWFGHD